MEHKDFDSPAALRHRLDLCMADMDKQMEVKKTCVELIDYTILHIYDEGKEPPGMLASFERLVTKYYDTQGTEELNEDSSLKSVIIHEGNASVAGADTSEAEQTATGPRTCPDSTATLERERISATAHPEHLLEEQEEEEKEHDRVTEEINMDSHRLLAENVQNKRLIMEAEARLKDLQALTDSLTKERETRRLQQELIEEEQREQERISASKRKRMRKAASPKPVF